MTEPVIPVLISPLPDAPLITDASAVFNDKAFPFAQALDPFGEQINVIATATNTNAVASKEKATASAASASASAASAVTAAGSVTEAANQVALAVAAKNSAETAAAAAGAAAGLPTLAGNANKVLSVRSDAQGVEWGDGGLLLGDVKTTVSLPNSDWIETNKIYLQLSYPELFAKVGLVSDGIVVSAMTYPAAPRIVVGGAGVLIAAGADVASVRRSTDGGATWATIAVPTTQTWGAGVYGGGVFALFASDGSTATTVAIISTDAGLTWQQKTVPSSRWSSAAYDPTTDTFMAVGGSSATGAVSVDKGQSWQSVTLPSVFSSALTPSIAAGGGVFLLTLGSGGASASCWTTSNKGAAWVVRTFPASNTVRSSAYLKGRFVVLNVNTATGSISDDLGATWETVSLPISMNWQALSASDSVIVGVGQQPGSHFISSGDGRSWRLQASPVSQGWLSVANDGVDFIASANATAGARIKTATYNRATQFFVPEPFVVIPPFKNWVKAK